MSGMTELEMHETSLDSLEVLRARLAKYEDADGKPITTIAEQARGIERLTEQLEHWLSLDKQRDAELAALKAQQSGVVPELPGEYSAACAAARLNSSPVSAGDPCMCGGNPHTTQCLYEHFLSYSGMADQPTLRYAYFHGAGFAAEIDQPSAGGVDERALYEQSCKERAASNGRVYEAHYFKRPAGVGEYLNPGAEHGWQVWQQARAALSANHSEQVRHMVPDGWKLVPVEPTRAMRYSVETTRLASAVTRQSAQHEIGVQVYSAMLAAAPSAGSQEQG
ncbi:MAG: hypothetical protein KKH62_08180 [Gammaproteobacteria bacterium]|nr:hypothetical protein [Gammaproteobacteria bacterium]